MRRNHILLATSLLLLLCAAASRATAQAPADMRNIVPFLMLVVDTSGSMERLPACICTTPSCDECLPDCTLIDNTTGRKKNRWAATLEALTGTFQDFECERLPRNSGSIFNYDIGYYLPYHQPWDCDSQLPGTPCSFDHANSTRAQNADGIIDTYGGSVRFGLMTFDGWDTYVGAPPLVSVTDFDYGLSNAVQGLWSFGGTTSSGTPRLRADGTRVGSFHYPNCATSYLMDTGVRSSAASEGTLVSLASCSAGPLGSPTCPTWCGACPATEQSLNNDIQEALLGTRPYGGTPIAASLDDLYWHLKDDTSDVFGSCRNRYALLITDGYPDDDYRSFRCNCANEGTDPLRCGPPPNNPDDMHCPYPTAEEAAADLVEGRGTDDPQIERLFVVGLAVDDPAVVTRLDAIADAGCTDTVENCIANPTAPAPLNTYQVFFANDVPTLIDSLEGVIADIIEPISRSVPAYALGNGAGSAQFQFSTGFRIAATQEDPWTGILERRRFDCGASPPDFAAINAGNGDLFHEQLNNQSTRRLWTAFPSTATSAQLEGTINSESGSCGTQGCATRDLTSSGVTNALLGVLNETERLSVLNWMYGTSGSVRSDKKLGAIYHSSPVIVGSPQFDTTDDAFNLFRQRREVAERPQVLYVGSNDGILHAFSVDSYLAPTNLPTLTNARDLNPGEELWGFVAPMNLNELRTNLSSHQLLMDATPTVKNVYFSRDFGVQATDQLYHTVLITGMRDGGNGYVALDVTNPFDPKFLWQFSDPQMGRTYAQPAIIQARFERPIGGTTQVKNGAIAILPGGVGNVTATDPMCHNGTTSRSMRRSNNAPYETFSEVYDSGDTTVGHGHRADIRCWQATGRALYFVDVEDGYLVKKIHLADPGNIASSTNLPVFPSPLVSTPAVFPAEVGTLSTRAFITDADGVIWRVDLNAVDPEPDDPMAGWTARPFHDIFWDGQPTSGEVAYEAPLLSVDNAGRPVVIVGTGDNNNFAKPTVENRVVSLTEVFDYTATQSTVPAEQYRAAFNWEHRVRATPNSTTRSDGSAITVDGLATSELVTGTMGLFDGTLYYGTFISVSASGDACDLGRGRVHAVNYLQRDELDRNGTNPETYGPKRVAASTDSDANSVINVTATAAQRNLMLMGLGITQRPSCTVVDTDDFSVWSQMIPGISQVTEPAIYLVAQASGEGSSLIETRGGSDLGSVELRLEPPLRLSKVTSWATSID